MYLAKENAIQRAVILQVELYRTNAASKASLMIDNSFAFDFYFKLLCQIDCIGTGNAFVVAISHFPADREGERERRRERLIEI